jgi:hypothetical protein
MQESARDAPYATNFDIDVTLSSCNYRLGKKLCQTNLKK